MCRMGLLSFIVLSFDFCVIVHVISLSLTDKIVVFGAKSIHYFINAREGSKTLYGQPFGRGTGPVHMNGVECQGNESSILQCNHRGWRKYPCDHSRDATVNCTSYRSMCYI